MKKSYKIMIMEKIIENQASILMEIRIIRRNLDRWERHREDKKSEE